MDKRLMFASALAVAAGYLSTAHAQSFTYNDFSNTSQLKLNGSAATATTGDGTVLRLTPANYYQGGSAFSLDQVQLQNQASFSTEFSFRMTDAGGAGDNDGLGADGIVFIAQTAANNVGGAGGGIGYQGIPHSLGVEFDTWNNGEISGNHVGIDWNGGLQDSPAVNIPTRMNNGDLWYAWIDYNGVTQDLQVRLADNSAIRPLAPVIDTTIDLPSLLGQDSAYVGFSAGTGAAFENQDIVSWQFNDNYQPIQQIGGGVPDSTSTLLLAAAGATLLLALGRRTRRQPAL